MLTGRKRPELHPGSCPVMRAIHLLLASRAFSGVHNNFCESRIKGKIVSCVHHFSVQKIGIFPVNRNRNRFEGPTSLQIGIGIVRKCQNLRIGIGIVFVRWEVFANNSQILEIFIHLFSPLFLILYGFPLVECIFFKTIV